MALLRGSFTLEEETRYKLDEEAPLTTPVDASVLRHCRFASRELWLCSVAVQLHTHKAAHPFSWNEQPRIENPFLGKEKKQKHFLFL